MRQSPLAIFFLLSLSVFCGAPLSAKMADGRLPAAVSPSVSPAEIIVTVWAKNPRAARSVLPKNYRVLDGGDENQMLEESGYIKPGARNAIFHQLGLEQTIAGLDELDKDILVMSARFEDIAITKKYYPMLSKAQLRSLQAAIKARRP